VTIRITATMPGASVKLEGSVAPAPLQQGRRAVRIGGTERQVEVLRGEPPPGTEIQGPAVVELPESTLLVAPDWSGAVDESGTIVLERTG